MFTIEQIKAIHAKSKTGADFPRSVQELIAIGVTSYTDYVTDGHIVYFGKNGFTLNGEARYTPLAVANKANIDGFKSILKIHQQGQTDYLTFCRQAAEVGVEMWIVDMFKLTCTYYDKAGDIMLSEKIPVYSK